jgi:Carboxypeptidase regulatory-like domain
MHWRSRIFLALIALLIAVPLLAQQTGTIVGRVTATDGSALPGVTVEARSTVLPSARVTTTDGAGNYRLPALVPGRYTLTYSLAGLQTLTRRVEVQLSETTTAEVKLSVAGVSEVITVTAASTLVDKTSTELTSGVSSQQLSMLPVGNDYRDLLKLAPGIQQTNDSTRGPSGGGSGQDNVYQIDGVNVTMPLYGTLSAEPSSYDVAQVTVTKGGAKAVDFNRSGGFLIDSVSKSGTNKIAGQVAYRFQNHASWMTASLKSGSLAQYTQDKSWANVNLGGPIVQDRLFFYASYFRPEVKRSSQSNVYGALPDYGNTRNEEFGKVTFTPTQTWLVNGSYRASKHDVTHGSFGSLGSATTGAGSQSEQKIGTLEGSWITNPKSYATFKVNDYGLKTSSLPDYPLSLVPSTALGTKLDIANLDKMGYVSVPTPITGNTAYNAFIAPYITKYGYLSNGVMVGGGGVGVNDTFDHDDFFRKSGQVGYNMSVGSNITHDLHVGYQKYTDTEELQRQANGWGDITLVGGRRNCPSSATACAGQPIYFQALTYQASFGSTPVRKIHADYKSQNIELNDTINMANWSFNVGLLASQDTLYGQGLKNDSSTISGYVLAPGNRYKMYEVPWKKMIQPRLGATWTYDGKDTLYASVARYNPAGSSLPRAASYDRNYTIRQINEYFDQNGVLIGVDPLKSSSGKMFQPNMDPRETKEYMIGTSQQLSSAWSARVYGRYRKSDHFWEDTNNTARIDYNAPAGIPHTPYVPDLSQKLAQIGAGSSYVIAQLDGAFTKYYEATAESQWRGENMWVSGSYTWSHYYGNFDQDNTSGAGGNDANIYIGSSNIADGPGHQLWNDKYGLMTGDRRHLLKLTGTYSFPWHGSAGAYALYQSGAPWTAWDYTKYNQFPDNSTSETIKFAEPAGSRRTPAHRQLDLNYTQGIPLRGLNLQVAADMFNVFNNQTGYNPDPRVHSSSFGQYFNYWLARTLQLTARVQF